MCLARLTALDSTRLAACGWRKAFLVRGRWLKTGKRTPPSSKYTSRRRYSNWALQFPAIDTVAKLVAWFSDATCHSDATRHLINDHGVAIRNQRLHLIAVL